jgi:sugar transferase EpsL
MTGTYSQHVKRLLDLIVASLAIVVLSPVLILLAALVRIFLGSPVIFRQRRPGLSGKPFTIYKFRTMTDSRNSEGKLLPNEQRVTELGRFLRSTSLDELPELFNVLKGDMSLVGPRPLRMRYLDRYTPEQARRHDVKPGMNGWAQIHGRNAITWEEKFELDGWYVDRILVKGSVEGILGLLLDLKILWLTLIQVLKREGINAEGHITMPEFIGSQPIGKQTYDASPEQATSKEA